MDDKYGENLIFLISQPRAGSTLLQRILGAHSQIYTASETWLMLHPLFALRKSGLSGEYNVAGESEVAIEEFLCQLPRGRDDYYEGVRRMYGYLYRAARSRSGKQLFLDKTPRYYLIVPDLHGVFPCARFIFLFRNPLAVFHSIIKTWAEHLRVLAVVARDFLDAPHLILQAVQSIGEKAIVLRYEDLLKSPSEEMFGLCQKLGIEFEPSLLTDRISPGERWALGDQVTVYEKPKPDQSYSDRWLASLKEPQIWRLLHDYLDILGAAPFRQMGYSFEEMAAAIRSQQPRWFQLVMTRSLRSLTCRF